MPYVKIYELKNDGSQEVVATCKLAGKTVKCEGNEIFVKNLETNGVQDYFEPKNAGKLFVKDGIKFLKNLKFHFKSGYLNASDIINEK